MFICSTIYNLSWLDTHTHKQWHPSGYYYAFILQTYYEIRTAATSRCCFYEDGSYIFGQLEWISWASSQHDLRNMSAEFTDRRDKIVELTPTELST